MPWYVGAGLSTLNVRDQSASPSDRPVSHGGPVVLTGLSVTLFLLRPMLELELVDPFAAASRQVVLFTGVTVRVQ
jgi:hypothetical protein